MNRNFKGSSFYWLKDENGELQTVVVDEGSEEEEKILDKIYKQKMKEKGLFHAWTTSGSPLLKASNKYKIIFWFLTFLIFPTVFKLSDFITNKKVRFIFLFVPFLILRLVLKKHYGVKNDEK